MATLVKRTCVCGRELPRNAEGMQNGWYCCDEYYCSQTCLDKSFEGRGETWLEHYDDDGDCYWTEWEDEEDFDD